MSNAGRAVFEAVGDFSGLRREAQRTEEALRGAKDEAKGLGGAIPRNGGSSARGLAGITDKVGELGDKIGSTGQSLSLKMTTPLTLLGGVAVRSFAKFESSLAQAGAKSDASTEQLKRMKDMALDLGAATMFSAGEAAAAMDVLAAAGLNAEDTMKALPGVMKGAQASGEDLTLTAETIAKAMNAFNVDASDSIKVADLFAQAANTTALGMEDIAYGIANAGEVGPRFGQDMEGVIATLGRLVDLGVPAASAGVAIRSALVNLAVPSNKASKVLNELGIKTRDAQGNMLQLPDLLRQVQDGLSDSNPALKKWAKQVGKTTPEIRDYALKSMFGVEGAKAFALAISDGKPVMLDAKDDAEKLTALQEGLAEVMGEKQADAWIKARTEQGKFVATGADAVKAIDAMGRASEGTSDKFVEVFGETTAAHIDAMWGSLESLAVGIVSTVAPALDDFLAKLTEVFNKIADFAEEHDWAGPLIVGVGLFLAALGPLLITLGMVLKAVRGIGKAGRGVGKVARFVTGRGKGKGAGAPVAGGAGDAGAQSVFWTKPMPVYIAKSKGGGKNGGGVVAGGGKGGGKGPVAMGPGSKYRSQGGRSFDDWKKENKATRSADRRARAGAAVRRGGMVAGGVGAGAGMGAGMTLAMGGSTGDAAKMAGIIAGIELAVMALGKAFTVLGPKIATAIAWVGRFALAGAKAVAKVIVQTAVIAARWAWMAVRAMVAAGRMAVAWLIGVIRPAGRAMARMAVAAAFMAAKWAWMAVKALWAAGRMALAWFIALGPVGWVIAAVVALALLIWKNWDKIKKWTADAWKWISDKVKAGWDWIVDAVKKGFDRAKQKVTAGWQMIKDAFWGAIEWIKGKLQPLIDMVGTVMDGAKNLGSKLKGGGIPFVPGLKTGGEVPGTGRGDKVLRRLEPGEFVVRRAVVQKPGMLDMLTRLNRNGAGGPAADTLPSANDLAASALAGSLPPTRPSVAPGSLGTSGGGRAGAAGGGGLTVIVNNPVPERAGDSVGAVLRRRTFDAGWAIA